MADRSSTGRSSAGGSPSGRSSGGRSSGGRSSAGGSSAGRSSGGRSSGGRSAGSGSRRRAARASGSGIGIGSEFDGAGEAAAGYGWAGDGAGLPGGWPSSGGSADGDWAGGEESAGSGGWAGSGDLSGGRARGRRIGGEGYRSGGGGYRSAVEDEANEPDDPESVARLICLRLLTAAPRTRAQLADALKRKGVPADAADSVLSRFAEVGLIDDATFAAAWVESRHYGRGLGRRALAAELSRRGVDRGDIEAAVDQLSVETERATALALVERRLAHTTGPSEAARIKKLVGMLARKGYSAGLAYSVVKEAIERAGQDASGLGDDDAFGYEFGEEEEFDGPG